MDFRKVLNNENTEFETVELPEINVNFSDRELRDYFLGKINDTLREAIDLAVMGGSESFFEKIEMIEDLLIADYLDGDLDAGDRELFESRMLISPKVVERINLLRDIKKAL